MQECGVRGPVLAWFQAYLSGRSMMTAVAGCTGSQARIKYGVPTGSVYGPVRWSVARTGQGAARGGRAGAAAAEWRGAPPGTHAASRDYILT
ncbi:unnamed protein product [Plutella xylostella]|uniref:(diamondback moth) hypothetical protein n=1 Tax=Plutella xylostella TaxID=51655 RepID=A0A8S4G4L8_PLUXY|nr:unnamed protein product [Plutella xylostella]